MVLIALLAKFKYNCPEKLRCDRTAEILSRNDVLYDAVIGTDPEEKAARKLLFKLAGPNNNRYPQFFFEDDIGDVIYLGDFEFLDAMDKLGSIPGAGEAAIVSDDEEFVSLDESVHTYVTISTHASSVNNLSSKEPKRWKNDMNSITSSSMGVSNHLKNQRSKARQIKEPRNKPSEISISIPDRRHSLEVSNHSLLSIDSNMPGKIETPQRISKGEKEFASPRLTKKRSSDSPTSKKNKNTVTGAEKKKTSSSSEEKSKKASTKKTCSPNLGSIKEDEKKKEKDEVLTSVDSIKTCTATCAFVKQNFQDKIKNEKEVNVSSRMQAEKVHIERDNTHTEKEDDAIETSQNEQDEIEPIHKKAAKDKIADTVMTTNAKKEDIESKEKITAAGVDQNKSCEGRKSGQKYVLEAIEEKKDQVLDAEKESLQKNIRPPLPWTRRSKVNMSNDDPPRKYEQIIEVGGFWERIRENTASEKSQGAKPVESLKPKKSTWENDDASEQSDPLTKSNKQNQPKSKAANESVLRPCLGIDSPSDEGSFEVTKKDSQESSDETNPQTVDLPVRQRRPNFLLRPGLVRGNSFENKVVADVATESETEEKEESSDDEDAGQVSYMAVSKVVKQHRPNMSLRPGLVRGNSFEKVIEEASEESESSDSSSSSEDDNSNDFENNVKKGKPNMSLRPGLLRGNSFERDFAGDEGEDSSDKIEESTNNVPFKKQQPKKSLRPSLMRGNSFEGQPATDKEDDSEQGDTPHNHGRKPYTLTLRGNILRQASFSLRNSQHTRNSQHSHPPLKETKDLLEDDPDIFRYRLGNIEVVQSRFDGLQVYSRRIK